MRKSRFTESQIVGILNEVEAGMKVTEVCRKHGITTKTYYAWKSKYGGMSVGVFERRHEIGGCLATEDEHGVRLQAALAEQTFTGTAGGGVVTATVRGSGELISVDIDASVLDPDDPELVGEVLDVLRSLRDEGMTMVLATHEMGFARAAADRVIFMSDGEIVEEATPEEFFANPQSSRARDFLSKILTH